MSSSRQNKVALGLPPSKSNILRLQGYLAPRISESLSKNDETRDSTGRKMKSTQRAFNSNLGFIPFESERDNLGRLKVQGEPPQHPQNESVVRHSSLPRLQRDEGIIEPVDLNHNARFKVIDGFERQINIIIRNKEFMSFLKNEKNKKLANSVGFMSQPRETKKQNADDASVPSTIDVNFNQVWPKPRNILIKPEVKLSQADLLKEALARQNFNHQKAYIDFGRAIGRGKNRAIDFTNMGERKPLMKVSPYEKDDSEDMEVRKLDAEFKHKRSSLDRLSRKGIGPEHNFNRIPKPLDQSKMNELRREMMAKYELNKMIKPHIISEKL